jgi:hypothetical protein
LTLRVSGGWMRGSRVAGCIRARDAGIDEPSDITLPATVAEPIKRLAVLMNERRFSIEDWRIGSPITRATMAIGGYYIPI